MSDMGKSRRNTMSDGDYGDKLTRDIDTLREIAGEDVANAVIKNQKTAERLLEQMKKDFDSNVPVEETLMTIVRDHGQAVALVTGSMWIHWFVSERVPQSLGRVDE